MSDHQIILSLIFTNEANTTPKKDSLPVLLSLVSNAKEELTVKEELAFA
jgi:hypothetical protein